MAENKSTETMSFMQYLAVRIAESQLDAAATKDKTFAPRSHGGTEKTKR